MNYRGRPPADRSPAAQGGKIVKKTAKKRLALSRETIVYLQSRDLERIAGGSIISSDNKECTFTALGFETTCWC